jgi:starvation-inducible DNA-binding protein
MDRTEMEQRQVMPLQTLSDLGTRATTDMTAALATLLGDMFALSFKANNFYCHMSGPHFHDFHLMLDEQADQIVATTDAIAGQARKIGGTTIRSVGHVSRLQRTLDNHANYVTPSLGERG